MSNKNTNRTAGNRERKKEILWEEMNDLVGVAQFSRMRIRKFVISNHVYNHNTHAY